MSLSCSLFPNISSSSFRFSGFMPEYLIHLYFILVESEKGIIGFSVLYVDVKFSHTGFTEEAFVSQMCNSCLFSKNQVAMVIWEGDKRARNVIRVHYIYTVVHIKSMIQYSECVHKNGQASSLYLCRT